MANSPGSNSASQEDSSDAGYPPFKYFDESMFPNNNGDFASSFMQPRGPASQLHSRPPAANPPPWEDAFQAWRYMDDRVWTGEAFVYSRRTQPETRPGRVSSRAFGNSSVGVASQEPRQIQASGGAHGFGGLGFIGEQQVPGGSQRHEAGNNTPSNTLVVFPPTHLLADSSSPTPGGRESAPQDSPAPPQKAARDSSPTNRTPFVFTGWNDDAKRELFMWKVKRKKGYAFFLHLFPGEKVESLHEAFKEYRDEGGRLFES